MLFANAAIKIFEKGGPIMYPILVVALVAIAVVTERLFWWIRESYKRDAEGLEKVLVAMEKSDFGAALDASKGSEDPWCGSSSAA